jgi:formiminotetrahydrofolate cyclodeaminase
VSLLMDLTGRQLLDAFAAPDPTPGGGSASALAGSLGTSLLLMVASLPKTRTGTPEAAAALARVASALRPIRDRMSALVDEDAQAYDAVVGAYRLPKASAAEQRVRQDAIQAALRRATDVPLEVMRAGDSAIGHAAAVARHGTPSAASDVGVALELLRSAVTGAALNVGINVAQVRDVEYVASATATVQRIESALGVAVDAAREALRG